MEVLLWLGFAQSLFSGILLLFVKKDKSLANNILTAWLFVISLEFLTTAIDFASGSNHLTNPYLIFNPLIYFYSRSLIQPGMKLKWWQLWHVIPFLFIKVGAYVTGTQFMPNEFFVIDDSTWFRLSMGILSILSFFGYTVPSIVMVHRYRMNIKNEFSTINSKITLGWLLFVIIFYFAFMNLVYMLGIINIITHVDTYSQVLTFSFFLALVYVFSFYGLLQQQIYSRDEYSTPDKYKNPRLNEQEKQDIILKMEQYFRKDKPFLNSDLTIMMVSEHLQVSRHTLTEVLNSGMRMNFYQFVNDYRIEDAKHKLSSSRFSNYSIEAIGFECGFNSKSSFYAVFKKSTGMTPTQYKASLK